MLQRLHLDKLFFIQMMIYSWGVSSKLAYIFYAPKHNSQDSKCLLTHILEFKHSRLVLFFVGFFNDGSSPAQRLVVWRIRSRWRTCRISPKWCWDNTSARTTPVSQPGNSLHLQHQQNYKLCYQYKINVLVNVIGYRLLDGPLKHANSKVSIFRSFFCCNSIHPFSNSA